MKAVRHHTKKYEMSKEKTHVAASTELPLGN